MIKKRLNGFFFGDTKPDAPNQPDDFEVGLERTVEAGVQGAGRVNTRLSGHDRKAINLVLNSQVYMFRASLFRPQYICKPTNFVGYGILGRIISELFARHHKPYRALLNTTTPKHLKIVATA